MTSFDAATPPENRKSLKSKEKGLPGLMVRTLILYMTKKSAGMGVPAWGGVEGLPPLFCANARWTGHRARRETDDAAFPRGFKSR